MFAKSVVENAVTQRTSRYLTACPAVALALHYGRGMSFDRVVPLVPHRTSLPRERRRQIRVDTLGQVEAHSVWKLQPMWLREISLTGFSIETTTPYEIGAPSKFRLTVDGQDRSVVVQAQAKYCTELPAAAGSLTIYVVGFEIIAPTAAVLRELTVFIDYAESLWV